MRYVPSLPPPITGGVDFYEMRALPGVKATPPVRPRSLPPLIFQHRREPLRPVGEQPERRHDQHMAGERRVYCRRSTHLPVLLELRSGLDRRRHAQRSTDLAEHVDEKV